MKFSAFWALRKSLRSPGYRYPKCRSRHLSVKAFYLGALINEELVEVAGAHEVVGLTSCGEEQLDRELEGDAGGWVEHLQGQTRAMFFTDRKSHIVRRYIYRQTTCTPLIGTRNDRVNRGCHCDCLNQSVILKYIFVPNIQPCLRARSKTLFSLFSPAVTFF